MSFPTSLTMEEKKLKEMFEKMKKTRKFVAQVLRNQACLPSGISGKLENRANRKSVEEAEFTTEEVKKKIKSGVITVKKANEKQTFKRANKNNRMSSDLLKKFNKRLQ